jgi:hypothetical protein
MAKILSIFEFFPDVSCCPGVAASISVAMQPL